MAKKPTYEELEELLEKQKNEAVKTNELLKQKIKEYKQSNKLMEYQRKLSVSIASTNDLMEGLRISLQLSIQMSGMDCGGIYLFDQESGDLNLIVHQGLSNEFVQAVSHYDKNSDNSLFVKKDKPAYTIHKDLEVSMTPEEQREGIQAFINLPLLDEGEVIGCMNLASHSTEDMPLSFRVSIETVVAQIGNAIGRLKARDRLRESEEHLRSLMESATNFAVYRLVSDETNPQRLRVKFISPSAKTILGIPEPMKFETWFENAHPDDVQRLSEANQRAFKTNRFNEEYRTYHKDRGEWRWIHGISTGGVNKKGWNRYVNGILMDITKRKRSEEALKLKDKELESKARDLEELNAALNVLLKKIKEEKNDLENSMLSNVSALIEPYLEKLRNGGLNERQKAYLKIIQTNLKEIVSPFARNFSSDYYRLTPQEIQIANKIKHGKTTKEIAALMNLSPKTIEFHRSNIRKKLGLNGTKENLRSHLSFMK
jgi:PAS domain S-box-containing protein